MPRNKRLKNKKEGDADSKLWPSQVFRDESIQVTSSMIPILDQSKKEPGGRTKKLNQNLDMSVVRSKRSKSILKTLIEIPPEQIRGAILNQGETYWATAVKTSYIIAGTSGFQFINYALVFGLTGHFRTILALLPIRYRVISLFMLMFIGDLLFVIIIRIGRRFSDKYNIARKYDMYFILLATAILFVTFISSLLYPIFTTPYLMVNPHGISKRSMTETECLRARDRFLDEGTSWDSLGKLKDMCYHFSLCISNCRDFRALNFWIYATYFMSVVRFLVIITIWNVVSFLCMIMNVKEQYYAGLPA